MLKSIVPAAGVLLWFSAAAPGMSAAADRPAAQQRIVLTMEMHSFLIGTAAGTPAVVATFKESGRKIGMLDDFQVGPSVHAPGVGHRGFGGHQGLEIALQQVSLMRLFLGIGSADHVAAVHIHALPPNSIPSVGGPVRAAQEHEMRDAPPPAVGPFIAEQPLDHPHHAPYRVELSRMLVGEVVGPARLGWVRATEVGDLQAVQVPSGSAGFPWHCE